MGVSDGTGRASLMATRFAFLRCLLQPSPPPKTSPLLWVSPGCKALLHKMAVRAEPNSLQAPLQGFRGRQTAPELAWLSWYQGATGTKKLPWSKPT